MKSDTIAQDLPKAAEPKNTRNTPFLYNTFLWRFWKARTSYMMVLPFLSLFLVFTVRPVVNSIYFSMTDYNGAGTQNSSPQWIGLENFKNLLSIHIMEQPRMVDEATGEFMYTCGRSRVTESEVAAEVADGKTCVPAYVRATDILPEGYTEYQQVHLGGATYLIGATDPRFLKALWNTTLYVFTTVIIRIVLGLMLAVVLRRQTRYNMFMRVIFFLPSVTAVVAITVIWGWIFRGQEFGLINSVLMHFGREEPISFLNDATWTMPVLIWLAVWGGIGFNMILFLAGLQNIPTELYEAAAIDGASSNQRFWRITLPLLRPTMIFVIVTGIIGSFQVFEPIYILFATAEGMGGVLDSGLTVVPYLYDKGFRLFQFGYASAIAWLLFIIIFVLTLINLRIGRADEAY